MRLGITACAQANGHQMGEFGVMETSSAAVHNSSRICRISVENTVEMLTDMGRTRC